MTHRRWTIGVLLAAGVLVNYIDRISLSVAAPQLQHDFHLSPQAVGFLFSAFFWSYSLAQLPGGLLLDRFGIKTVGRWGTFLWSAASGATALCSGYAGIFTARLLLGIAEAPGMIGNQKATGLWFPTRERCRSTAIFDSAAKFANVIGVPIVAFFVVGFGWRWGFAITAFLSFLYFAAYWFMYRDPSEDRHLSAQEHAYILEGGAVPEGQAVSGQANMLAYVLQNRKVWAHMIGYSAYGYSFYLFLTWLPGYLVESLHMSILKSAGFATIPWIFASFADLLIGGFFVDYLIGRGLDETKVRKVAIACGMAAGLAVFEAPPIRPILSGRWYGSPASRCPAFRPAAPVASPPSSPDPSPRRRHRHHRRHRQSDQQSDGRRRARDHCGFIVGLTHSFAGAFLVAGLVLIVGIFSYLVLLGRIEPIPDPPART